MIQSQSDNDICEINWPQNSRLSLTFTYKMQQSGANSRGNMLKKFTSNQQRWANATSSHTFCNSKLQILTTFVEFLCELKPIKTNAAAIILHSFTTDSPLQWMESQYLRI